MSQQHPHNPDPSQQPRWGQAPQQGQQSAQPSPGQAQQPQWGSPGYTGGPVPPQGPQKPWVARHKALTAIGGVFAVLVIIGIAAGGDDSSDTKADTAASTPAKADNKPADKPAEKTDDKPAEPAKEKADKPAPKPKTQADQFKAFINTNGTSAEKVAVKHVTKVQGADSSNDILDAAEVFTDYTGGLMGPHAGDGKILASAFADWKSSKNGLVTVYDAAGELLSNGNY